MKLCDKCGYRHGYGRCCIDIYQQLGQVKGPSIAVKVLLAFILPLLFFIGSGIVAENLLSHLIPDSGLKTLLVFLSALTATLIFVQIIRILTRKPIVSDSEISR